MKNGIRFGACTMFGLAAFAMATPAHAQATRTWVSGVGDDVNPCSRTAPCKTFAGAISKTAPGGEINCLDPGGFGTLTITKSITVDCTGTFGSTLNSGGINGFVVNDSATLTPNTIEVRLRGLSINGAGSTPGLNGIRFISGKSLVVEDVFIQNQKSGSGISIAPSSAPAKIYLRRVTIVDSGTASTGGIQVRPTGSGSAQVSMVDVMLANNAGAGLLLDTSASTGAGIIGSAERSSFVGSANGISGISGTPATTFMVVGSQVYANTTNGISASGANTRIRVGETTITANTTGVSHPTGFVSDVGGNRLTGNGTDGAFN